LLDRLDEAACFELLGSQGEDPQKQNPGLQLC
jgi:hypothetical protein